MGQPVRLFLWHLESGPDGAIHSSGPVLLRGKMPEEILEETQTEVPPETQETEPSGGASSVPEAETGEAADAAAGTAEPAAEPEKEPEPKLAAASEPSRAFQEYEQLQQGYAAPPSAFPEIDLSKATPEQIKQYQAELKEAARLGSCLAWCRGRFDGRDGNPPYDEAIKKSGLHDQWNREAQAGGGPLIKAVAKYENPYLAAYEIAVGILNKQGASVAPTSAEHPLQPPRQAAIYGSPIVPSKTVHPKAPPAKPGLAGQRGGGVNQAPKYTMESVAKMDVKEYKRLPAEVRERAKMGTLPRERR